MMHAANNMLIATRGCSAVSNGCRGVTARSSSSSSHASTSRRGRPNNNHRGSLAAATSAGAACAMCTSVRMTAACSASTSLHLRHAHSYSSHENIYARSSSLLVRRGGGGGQPHFGSGMSPSLAVSSSSSVTKHGALSAAAACTALNIRTINSSSHVKDTFGGIMESGNLGAAATAISSQEALLDGAQGAASASGWSARELAGAVLFAGAASAGSMLLGPIDSLRGGKTGPG
eukprot:CAMPEP_0183706418 /NCGR_PEP_ID=MMETSP0737-20130205/3261_1 /TAXON_ID=385413 /ORGANISM="Thalassiosira miniscula, Strain CCMP1093" /LENGTH=231 /DNA_ID=CAMNT_0025933831 /DNA_START=331 /DNA_END=1022 /DNA_ORIENTATION=+